MIEDVVAEARPAARRGAAESADDVRAPAAVVAFSPRWRQAEAAIKAFLFQRMYRHPRVMRVMDEAEAIVRDLFARYPRRPGDMPAEWRRGARARDARPSARARSAISSPA